MTREANDGAQEESSSPFQLDSQLDSRYGWTFLARLLAGELTDEELGEVQTWIDAEPGRQATFEDMKKEWERAKEYFRAESHIDAVWDNLRKKIRG